MDPGSSEAGGEALLGRGPELTRMVAGLALLASGRGSAFLLVGEPGIGKTRLADEVAAEAGRRAVPVAWGRSWDAGGAPAYWPWTQILQTILAATPPDSVIAVLPEAAPALRSLVPGLRARIPAPAPERDPERGRFVLFAAMAALLRWRTESAPLVLVLDDLHAADRASILLFEFVARELRTLPVLLIGCYRDVEGNPTPEVADALARASREGECLQLRRLDRAETSSLLQRAGGGLDGGAAAAVFEATRGNPLFIRETLRLLASERPGGQGAPPVMYGVREVIRRRLQGLTPSTRAVLDVGAVIGERFSLATLAAASGEPATQLAEALAPATAMGVVVEQAERGYGFSHALWREVVYRDVPRTRRVEIHLAVGHALARGQAGDLDAPFAEMAHHFLEASPSEPEAGPRYALRAAAQALERLAWEDAAALLERARASLELAPELGHLRGEVLLALGLARIRSGDSEKGKRLCQQAAEVARRLADGSLLARVALTYGVEIKAASVDPILVGLLEEAEAQLPAGERALRARVKARLAAAQQPAEQPQVPIRLAREAIALARELGDKATLLEVLHDAMGALMEYVPADERLPLNLEQESLAGAMGDRIRALRANQRLVIDHLERGELAMMDARIGVCERLGRELPQLRQQWQFPLFRAVRAAFEGRFADAEQLAAEAGAVAAKLGVRAGPSLVLHRYAVLRIAERYEEAKALERELLAAWTGLRVAEDFVTAIMGATRARSGDVAGAGAHFAQIRPDSFALGHDEPCTMAEVAEVCVALGDQPRAQGLYRGLLPLTGRLRCVGLSAPFCDGAYDAVLGRLAIAIGRLDEGIEHLEAAAADLERLGGRPALVRAQVDLASALRARGRPDDLTRVGSLLSTASVAAEALSLTTSLQALQALRAAQPEPAAAGAAVPDAPVLSFDLRQEGEVWSLTCNGRVARLKDSRALRTLARLIANPGCELHVLDLVGSGEPGGSGDAVDGGDAGELLDEQARDSYRRRLAELRDIEAEAESMADHLRASRAREEIELLGAELSRAVGLGGRQRRASAAAERARVAVQRRIRDAIRRIGEAFPEVGRHLDWAVRTGSCCSYRPRGQR
jgi:hypothetical protein